MVIKRVICYLSILKTVKFRACNEFSYVIIRLNLDLFILGLSLNA